MLLYTQAFIVGGRVVSESVMLKVSVWMMDGCWRNDVILFVNCINIQAHWR